ncbi:hypothetical protein [Streptomyces anulatus]|uniref:hypothetical protein n=1 Tax=Streptomyces anulatus TaxID=1892 RepID=UPI0033ED36E7|nr:hypothetical protein OG238_30640 [Streptomyces anulatus]
MKAALAGGLGFLALGGTSTWLATADASAAATEPRAAATADMPSLVEDFIHPGAERILQDRKIVLKRGDGNIMLKPGNGEGGMNACLGANNVFVESRLDKQGFCFVTTGTTGYLTMEIPDAFFLWTQDQPMQATVTADGKTTVYKAPENDVTEIGETDTPGGEKRSVLVELRISK